MMFWIAIIALAALAWRTALQVHFFAHRKKTALCGKCQVHRRRWLSYCCERCEYLDKLEIARRVEADYEHRIHAFDVLQRASAIAPPTNGDPK